MTIGGPGLWGDSVRKALNPNEERAARAHEIGAEQALRDKEELRELELSGAYSQTPLFRETTEDRQPSRIRSALARIFRRSA
jgi:hypothetical protein